MSFTLWNSLSRGLLRITTSLIDRPVTLLPTSPTLYWWTAIRLKSGVKTNSGCKKRFRLRGNGSIKRGKSGKSHNTGYKDRQRVNRLGSSTGIEGKAMEQRVRKLLGAFNLKI